jgi:hypothetical protein
MPIVPHAESSENVSDYSHSTVFTVTLSAAIPRNAPPLLKIYTQSSQCIDRWMLADAAYTKTTFVQTNIIGTSLDSARPNPTGGSQSASGLTVWSIDTDPLFASCQPYSRQPLYSPGVCPDGLTAAEVTEFHATQTGGSVLTSWVASCCRR